MLLCVALTVLRQFAGHLFAHRPSLVSVAIAVAKASALNILQSECTRYGFCSVDLLLRVMKLGSVVTSGSLVLKLLHLSDFKTGDINFYMAEHAQEDNVLIDFLYICGYTMEQQPCFDEILYTSSSTIRSVKRLVCVVGDRKTEVNIVFVAILDVVYRAVLELHSTLVMNVLAWYGIVCLYPR